MLKEAEMNKSMRLIIVSPSMLLILVLSVSTAFAAPNPFMGMWESTDTDGGHQTLAIGGSPGIDHHIRYLDYGAIVYGLGPDGEFLYKAFAKGVLTEGTQAGFPILTGTVQFYCQTLPPSALPYFSDLRFTYDPTTDTLVDQWGVVWSRM